LANAEAIEAHEEQPDGRRQFFSAAACVYLAGQFPFPKGRAALLARSGPCDLLMRKLSNSGNLSLLSGIGLTLAGAISLIYVSRASSASLPGEFHVAMILAILLSLIVGPGVQLLLYSSQRRDNKLPSFDDNRPDNRPFEFINMDQATYDHYASAGALAGEQAGRRFREWCKPGSYKDYLTFPNAVANAIHSARTQMLEAGATPVQCDLWTWAFRQAFAPHTEGYEDIFEDEPGK
jgi:hypothetical protein